MNLAALGFAACVDVIGAVLVFRRNLEWRRIPHRWLRIARLSAPQPTAR